MKIYQTTVAFYIGLASITSSYLSDIAVDAKKSSRKKEKNRVTRQAFRVTTDFDNEVLTVIAAESFNPSTGLPVPSAIGTKSYLKGNVYIADDNNKLASDGFAYGDPTLALGDYPEPNDDNYFLQECTITNQNDEGSSGQCSVTLCAGEDFFGFPNCAYLFYSGVVKPYVNNEALGFVFKATVIGGSGDFLGMIGEAKISVTETEPSLADPTLLDIEINTIATISEKQIADIEKFK